MNPLPPLEVIPEPILSWFRSRSKRTQWLVGLPTILLLVAAALWEAGRTRSPEEPQQAVFWTLVLLVVAIVLSELLRPKPALEDARPALLGDFQLTTATEGRVVPLLWGRVRVRGPNVVWYGDLEQTAIRQRIQTGLWSSTRIIKAFRYRLGIQLAICRGPGVVLRQVWVGEDSVWTGTLAGEGYFDIDLPQLFDGDDYGQGGLRATVDFYPGDQSQSVSPYLNAVGRQRITAAATPTAPRYPGTCHLVIRQLTSAPPTATDRGAYVGNATSIRPWSFEVERYPALFAGQSAGQNKVGADDANPINVVYELLVNNEWGFGFSPSEIDVGAGSSFKTSADTMISEGNGWSMLLDRAMPAKQLLEELQRQIDGVVFLDHRTGKWRIKLVRADYDINTVLQLDDSNVKEVRDFTRGSWEDTTNQIQVKFAKREDDYKESYALAQDLGNAIISAGGSTSAPVAISAASSYPGVKIAALASQLAWRDLRTQSYPLARVQLVVNRQNWSVRIGDVVAWTNVALGFTQLPLRITRVNYGKLQDNQMVLTCVQDVFKFAAPSMGTPPPSGWTPPVVSLFAYLADAQLAFEAPRALLVRDPEFAGDATASKVFCSARRFVSELGYQIRQRNSAGPTSGAYFEAGEVVAFMRVGKLAAALAAGTAIPTSTITIVPDPDSQVELEEVFDDATTVQNLGTNLTQLVLVGTEFMLVRAAANSGPNVNLQDVYRGVLDSAQESHALDAPVYLVFVGSGLTDTAFPNTHNVDIELRMRSASSIYAGAVTPISFTMAKRALRPYPPAAPLYNGSSTAYGTLNVDSDGSGMNGSGANIRWRRRDFRATNEVAELLTDNVGVDASTEYRVRVFVDPAGINVEVLTSGWATGSGPVFLNRLLVWDEAPAGTQLRVRIETRHDILTEVNLTSRYNLIHDALPVSAYDALFYLGGKLSATVESNVYTTLSTGTYTLRIGAAYSTSNVQVSINAGAYSTVIAAGLTNGTFAVTAGDTVRVRHTTNQAPSPNLVQLEDPSTAVVAYGVLKN